MASNLFHRKIQMKKKVFFFILVLTIAFAFGLLYMERKEIYDKAVVELKIGNTDGAIVLFRKSYSLGYKNAKIELIMIYALGIGINPDRETAFLLIKDLKKKDQLKQIKSIIFSIENAEFNDLANKDLEFWKNKLRELLARQSNK